MSLVREPGKASVDGEHPFNAVYFRNFIMHVRIIHIWNTCQFTCSIKKCIQESHLF
jgi:hypothetical protein